MTSITTAEMLKIPMVKTFHVKLERFDPFEIKWLASDDRQKLLKEEERLCLQGWGRVHYFEGECHDTFASDENYSCHSKSTFKNWIK